MQTRRLSQGFNSPPYMFNVMHQIEADFIGLHLMAAAGFDPRLGPAALQAVRGREGRDVREALGPGNLKR